VSLHIHDSDALTRTEADAAIKDYPNHTIVYAYDGVVEWEGQTFDGNPFQIEGWLDRVGVPVPRLVLNLKGEQR